MSALLVNLAEAFLQPRHSALRILSTARNWQTTVLLGLLAFSLQALLTIITRAALGIGQVPQNFGEPEDPSGITPFGMGLLLAAIVGMVFGIGRLFGGPRQLAGSRRRAVVVWRGNRSIGTCRNRLGKPALVRCDLVPACRIRDRS